VGSLAEWLYHLLAVTPDEGFAALSDHVAEALFVEEWAAATRLTSIGPELRLSKDHTIAIRRFAELAGVLRNNDHQAALELLEDVTESGPGSPLLEAVAEHMSGTSARWVGQSHREVVQRLTAAHQILDRCEGPVSRRIQCSNAIWLGHVTAELETFDAALRWVDEAQRLADELDEAVLRAETLRVRGLVLERTGDPVGARERFDEAIGLVREARMPSDYGRMLIARGQLALRIANAPQARDDLVKAERIFRKLDDPQQKEAVLALLDLAILEDDPEEAQHLLDRILDERGSDPEAENEIAATLLDAGRREADPERARELVKQAVAFYDRAIGHAADPLLLAYRATAYLDLASQSSANADEVHAAEEAARRDLVEAHTRVPGNENIAFLLADRLRAVGDANGAAEVVAELLETLHRLMKKAGLRDDLSDDVRDALVKATEFLPSPRAVSVLETWGETFAKDPQVHYLRGLAYMESADADSWTLERATEAFRLAFELTDGASVATEQLGGRQADTADVAAPAIAPNDLSAAPAGLAPEGPTQGTRYLLALADALARSADADNWSRAEAHAARVLELNRHDPHASEIVERIERQRRRDAWTGDAPVGSPFTPPLRVQVGDELLRWVDPELAPDDELFEAHLPAMRARVREDTFINPPGVRVSGLTRLGPRWFRVLVSGLPRVAFNMAADYIAGASPAECARHVESELGEATTRPWDGGEGTWATADALPALSAANIPVWDPRGCIAAVVDSVIRKHRTLIIGSQYASFAAYDYGWPVTLIDAPRVASLLRELTDLRIDPAEIPVDRVMELLSAPEGNSRGAHAAPDLQPQTAEPISDPLLYALGQERRRRDLANRWEPWRRSAEPYADETPSSAVLTIRTPADREQDTLGSAAERIVESMCAALQVPPPPIMVEPAAVPGTRRLEIAIDGVIRFSGEWPTSWRPWWSQHPVSAQLGRSSECAPEIRADDQPATEVFVCRAIEEVLIDDPGLLLPPDAARRLCERATGDPERCERRRLAVVLRELASRRIPLGSLDQLRDRLDAVMDLDTADDDDMPGVAPADTRVVSVTSNAHERLIPDDFPPGIHETLKVNEDAPLRGFRLRVAFRHPYPGELHWRLTAPYGATVELPQASDASGRTLFVDSGVLEHAERFLDRSPLGAWTLQVSDRTPADAGVLLRWALDLRLDASPSEQAEVDGPESRPAIEQVLLPDKHRVCIGHLQRLARELRPFEVQVRLSPDLYEALDPDSADSRLRNELEDCLRKFTRESGRDPRRAVKWNPAPELHGATYQIVINHLPRALGRLPIAEVFVESPGGAAIAPWNGKWGTWIDPNGADESAATVDAVEFLARHLGACLTEAIAEFLDLTWTEEMLELLDQSGLWANGISERLIDFYGTETIAATIEQLAFDGVSIRDGRLSEALLELCAAPATVSSLDAAPPPDAVAPSPEALASYVRLRLGDSIAFALADEQGTAALPLLELKPADEKRLRHMLSKSEAPVPVYGIPELGVLLAAVERAIASHPDARYVGIVTAVDLRRHVRRAIAAQFPKVPVFAREELSDGSPVEVVGALKLGELSARINT
jgi:flagellar biosynthesis component FlhA/subtilisin-like proprotein convertase family protein